MTRKGSSRSSKGTAKRSTPKKGVKARTPKKGTGRKRARGKKKQTPVLTLPDFSWLFHPGFWAAVALVFALLTAGSLAATSEGLLTAWWYARLRHLVGSGIYILPPAALLVAWWLARYAVASDERDREAGPVSPPTWRIAGVGLVVLNVAAALHLFAFSPDPQRLAEEGGGGGVLGWVFSDLLVRNLGEWLAVPALGLLTLAGLLMALAVSWSDLTRAAFWIHTRIPRWRPATPVPSLEPSLPGLTESLNPPWWRRLWPWRPRSADLADIGRIIGEDATAQSPAVSPITPVDQAPEAPATSIAETPTPTPPPPTAAPAPPEPAVSGLPRPAQVIGEDVAGQGWQLPDIRAIFEDSDEGEISEEEIRQRARTIEETLAAFGVPVRVVEVNRGPAVTQFGVQPGYIERVDRRTGSIRREKVKVARILSLQNDLALALAAAPIRIEAPVPGKPVVGIEVPNKRTSLVTLRSILESDVWRTFKGHLKIALGQDVAGKPVVADLTRMPHLLIAGATGSGKSVCINAIICCLMATRTPEEVRFILIDPKRVELTAYEGVPHLAGNVLTDVDMVIRVLEWAVREMERRYDLFAKEKVRNIVRYNRKVEKRTDRTRLPYLVIVVDELADLMMSSPDDVEHHVVRLAQMARATGLHLVLATQRPSVDVVTGLIKANFPARISFAVTSQVDSRVILDSPGAEHLLGRGDMLFLPPDSSKLARLQGAFVSDREIQRLVTYWRQLRPPAQEEMISAETTPPAEKERKEEGERVPVSQAETPPDTWEQRPLWEDLLGDVEEAGEKRDPLFDEAVRVVREANRASISLLQRRLQIGYARAGRLIDQLEAAGIIGPDPGGGRSRPVYSSVEEESSSASRKENDHSRPTSTEPPPKPRVWY